MKKLFSCLSGFNRSVLDSLLPGIEHVPQTGSFSPDELKERVRRNFRQPKQSEDVAPMSQARHAFFTPSVGNLREWCVIPPARYETSVFAAAKSVRGKGAGFPSCYRKIV